MNQILSFGNETPLHSCKKRTTESEKKRTIVCSLNLKNKTLYHHNDFIIYLAHVQS